MPDLKFEIISAEVRENAVAPTLTFNLKITNSVKEEEVYAAGLKCQVMIEAIHRQYNGESKRRLLEVFGEPARWQETVGNLFWTIVNITIPRFTGETIVDINIPCSEDHSVAAGKYFYSLKDGKVPLAFLFSGTLFYKEVDGNLQITQVPWEKEATYEMPVSLWQNMMDIYFPNSRWLKLQSDVFDKLFLCKSIGGYTTIENCIEALAEEALGKKKASEKQSI